MYENEDAYLSKRADNIRMDFFFFFDLMFDLQMLNGFDGARFLKTTIFGNRLDFLWKCSQHCTFLWYLCIHNKLRENFSKFRIRYWQKKMCSLKLVLKNLIKTYTTSGWTFSSFYFALNKKTTWKKAHTHTHVHTNLSVHSVTTQ